MTVRSLLASLVLVASASCVGPIDSKDQLEPGAGPANQVCELDNDCVAVAPTCCECPTFAVSAGDPVADACDRVTCPPKDECPANFTAVCGEGSRCELVCAPLACEASQACAEGFAMDANGCLTCECAVPLANGCTEDDQCSRTRADCCGCARGGYDTAVLTTDLGAFEAMLACRGEPLCPDVDTCTAEAPACVAGRCTLVTPVLPPGACGRPDLPACAAGSVCVVNASDQANMHGVGLCQSVE